MLKAAHRLQSRYALRSKRHRPQKPHLLGRSHSLHRSPLPYPRKHTSHKIRSYLHHRQVHLPRYGVAPLLQPIYHSLAPLQTHQNLLVAPTIPRLQWSRQLCAQCSQNMIPVVLSIAKATTPISKPCRGLRVPWLCQGRRTIHISIRLHDGAC